MGHHKKLKTMSIMDPTKTPGMNEGAACKGHYV
jgi:hypothetical protein